MSNQLPPLPPNHELFTGTVEKNEIKTFYFCWATYGVYAKEWEHSTSEMLEHLVSPYVLPSDPNYVRYLCRPNAAARLQRDLSDQFISTCPDLRACTLRGWGVLDGVKYEYQFLMDKTLGFVGVGGTAGLDQEIVKRYIPNTVENLLAPYDVSDSVLGKMQVRDTVASYGFKLAQLLDTDPAAPEITNLKELIKIAYPQIWEK